MADISDRTLRVITAGLQTTVQGGAFEGLRHQAMPSAGAADPLSLALANRLVGKPLDSAALEIAMGGFEWQSHCDMRIAITGAPANCTINGQRAPQHMALFVGAMDIVKIGPVLAGCRVYLSISLYFAAPTIFNSQSTYLPAQLGGFKGRSLKQGDVISLSDAAPPPPPPPSYRQTPHSLHPHISAKSLLRIVAGPEVANMPDQLIALTAQPWTISPRSNRMGLKLMGDALEIPAMPPLKSSAVFPGTIQCPPDGLPYILGVDGQTTGGYPRIAQVIRADRHLIGQLGAGASVELVVISPDRAREICRNKTQKWAEWLPGLSLA